MSDPEALIHSLPAELHERWAGPRGRLEISSAAPGVFLTRFEGKMEAPYLRPLLAHMDRLVAMERWPHVFEDIEGATGYDPEVRDAIYAWTKTHRHHLGPIHILHRSTLIGIGVRLANVKLGGLLVGYRDRARFEAALADAARGGV